MLCIFQIQIQFLVNRENLKILSQYTRPFINKSDNPIFLRTIIRILFTPKEKKYISTKNRLDIFKI